MRGSRASIWIAIALGFIAPSMSHAQYLKCASRTITAADAGRALSAAKRAAGALTLRKSTLWVCMNPGRGTAWLDAEPEPQADTSELRHSLRCSRDTGPWSCELQTSRYAIADFDAAGIHRHVEMGLPADMDVALARLIVARAFQLAPTVRNGQECGAKPFDPEEAHSRESSPEVRAAFVDDAEIRYVEVSPIMGGIAYVTVNDIIISLTRSPDGGDWQVSCWSEQIVVT